MIYKLNGPQSSGAVTDGIATLDIQEDGFITAVMLNIHADGMDAFNDRLQGEVSFMSSNTFDVNDTRGSICMHSLSQQLLTSGGGIGASSIAVSGLQIPVDAGERVHLHGKSEGGSQAHITCYLYVEDSQDSKQRPKRRLR